jgi:hypothetical protein
LVVAAFAAATAGIALAIAVLVDPGLELREPARPAGVGLAGQNHRERVIGAVFLNEPADHLGGRQLDRPEPDPGQLVALGARPVEPVGRLPDAGDLGAGLLLGRLDPRSMAVWVGTARLTPAAGSAASPRF